MGRLRLSESLVRKLFLQILNLKVVPNLAVIDFPDSVLFPQPKSVVWILVYDWSSRTTILKPISNSRAEFEKKRSFPVFISIRSILGESLGEGMSRDRDLQDVVLKIQSCSDRHSNQFRFLEFLHRA